jgi:hypothetical protein
MRSTLTCAIIVAGTLSSLGCAARPHQQPLAYAPRADIEITSSPNTSVLIYSTVPSQFALAGQELRTRSDTVRATTPVRLEAYLTSGEIHVTADGSVALNVDATIAHAPAKHATATGRHIVIDAGGTGIRSVR